MAKPSHDDALDHKKGGVSDSGKTRGFHTKEMEIAVVKAHNKRLALLHSSSHSTAEHAASAQTTAFSVKANFGKPTGTPSTPNKRK